MTEQSADNSSPPSRLVICLTVFGAMALVGVIVYSSWKNRTWGEKFVGGGFKIEVRGINSQEGPTVDMISPSGKVYEGQATSSNTEMYAGNFDHSNVRFVRDAEGMKIWIKGFPDPRVILQPSN
ncbi:MAG: hypothetical protein N2C12_01950 [Planctomycetales bacterium]